MGETTSNIHIIPETERVVRTKSELRVISQNMFANRGERVEDGFDELFGINKSEKDTDKAELDQKRDEWITNRLAEGDKFNERELSFLKRSLVARDRFEKLDLSRDEKGKFVKKEKEFVAPVVELDIDDSDLELVVGSVDKSADKKIKNKLIKNVFKSVAALMTACSVTSGVFYANFSEQVNSLAGLLKMLAMGAVTDVQDVDLDFNSDDLVDITDAFATSVPQEEVEIISDVSKGEQIEEVSVETTEQPQTVLDQSEDVWLLGNDNPMVDEEDEIQRVDGDDGYEAEADEIVSVGLYDTFMDITLNGLNSLHEDMVTMGVNSNSSELTEILNMIDLYESKRENGEPFVVNLVIHDNFRYGEAGDDRAYSRGSEHQGSADGVFQIRVFPDGRIGVVSFGRDLETGIPVMGEDGLFSMDYLNGDDPQTVELINGVIVQEDGSYVRNSDGSMRTRLENGGQAYWFEENTGEEGDVNMIISLEVMFDLVNNIYPEGVTFESPFDLDLESSDLQNVGGDIHLRAGETTTLTGQQFFFLLRSRDISIDGEYVDSGGRGTAVLRAFIDDPDRLRAVRNLANLIPSSDDMANGLGAVFGRDSSDRRVTLTDTNSRILMTIFRRYYRTNPQIFAESLSYNLLSGVTNSLANDLVPFDLVNIYPAHEYSQEMLNDNYLGQVVNAFDLSVQRGE